MRTVRPSAATMTGLDTVWIGVWAGVGHVVDAEVEVARRAGCAVVEQEVVARHDAVEDPFGARLDLPAEHGGIELGRRRRVGRREVDEDQGVGIAHRRDPSVHRRSDGQTNRPSHRCDGEVIRRRQPAVTVDRRTVRAPMMSEAATSPEPTALRDGIVFEPIARETLSALIRDRLVERITSGELEPGARMPSERRLSEQFGVARTSVREAIQGLLSLGVIERRGNRSYVVRATARGPGRRRRADDSQGVRPPAVRDPARARAADLPDGRRASHRRPIAPRSRRWPRASDGACRSTSSASLDRTFHTPIASACGNPLLVELYGKVLDRCSVPTSSPRCCPPRPTRPRSNGSSTGRSRHHA